MKGKFNIKKILLLLVTAIIMLTSSSTMAFAAEKVVEYPFDKTNVLDDLKSSDGFSIGDYYFDVDLLTESAGITNFVEWCFAENGDQSDYALYVYFYNPQKLEIKTDSLSNRIQMAIAYDKGKAYASAAVTEYETFQLIYCNKSTQEGYEGLFYKFRIHLTSTAKRLLLLNLQKSQRRYDVSGITLATKDSVKEFPVGGTFRFTGYAKGYAVDTKAESTLECLEFLPFETIRLEVTATNYRTATSSLEKGHQNDITSVYFSVPKKYIYDEDGNEIANLQRIKAEWWEYKTTPIYVVGSQAAYDAIVPYLGQKAPSSYDSSFASGYSLMYNPTSTSTSGYQMTTYLASFNPFTTSRIAPGTPIDRIDWFFPCTKTDESKVLVTKKQLETYATTYNTSAVDNLIPVGSKFVSGLLFQDTVDDGRTRGYNVKEFDNTADRFDILSYKDTHTGWQAFFEYGFFRPSEETRENVAPIEMIKKADLDLTNDNLGYTYLVNSSDVVDFRKDVKAAWDSDEEVPYIFHFAQTDYYSEVGNIYKDKDRLIPSYQSGTDTQRSVETVFLDFKIITLTFKSAEEYKVVPVTQDPINIYKSVTEHPDFDFEGEDDVTFWDRLWTILLIVLGVVLELILIYIESRFLSFDKGNIAVTIIVNVIIIIAGFLLDFYIGKCFIDAIKSYGWLLK